VAKISAMPTKPRTAKAALTIACRLRRVAANHTAASKGQA